VFAVVACLDLEATVALATPGAQLWAKRYNGFANDLDHPTAVKVSPDGSKVFVTGESRQSRDSNSDYATIAYNAFTGAQLWLKRYNGPGNRNDQAAALGVSSDGSKVFVTGRSRGSSSFDYATIAYNASTGARLWLKRYDASANRYDAATALAVRADGTKVFVTGRSQGSTVADYATVAYNASTGAQLWVKRYDGPGDDPVHHAGDVAKAVGVSPDGSKVFVTGGSESTADTGYATSLVYTTIAYSASNGDKLWLKRYDSSAVADDATALGVSPDGSKVFVTGENVSFNSRFTQQYNDSTTVAYNASTGAQRWAKRYHGYTIADRGQGLEFQSHPPALAVSSGGSKVFLAGTTGAFEEWNYATVAYNASTGTQVWARQYGDGVADAASAVAVGPNGSKIFVTGNGSGDYATVAYQVSNGAQLWAKRYDYETPPDNADEASALAVSPDGSKLFVTGGSINYPFTQYDPSGLDYATIAYGTG